MPLIPGPGFLEIVAVGEALQSSGTTLVVVYHCGIFLDAYHIYEITVAAVLAAN
ncbi:MAG: hypothetical protein VX346_25610 [Planctomycetota bacterium]|nr:hypothetical protein [Planctomycetota bacterium]